jgi:hypothetical protein
MATATTTRRPVVEASTPAVRSVSLTDRVALRVGLALIVWSRRTHRPAPSLDLGRSVQLGIAEREASWQRQAAFLGRWR